MSPFVSSSGLSPGSCEAKVQRAKVCLNCTEPSAATSSCWSLPVGGTCRIHAARTWWWSLRGELRAIWPKSRRRLLVTRWESGEQPVVLLTSAFDTWRVYGNLKINHLGLDQHSCTSSDPVSTKMGDHLQAGEPCNKPPRSTQPSTLCGTVKWVSFWAK